MIQRGNTDSSTLLPIQEASAEVLEAAGMSFLSLLPAISLLCGQQNSFGSAIHLQTVTSIQVSARVSRLAEPLPLLQVFFLIDYGICRYSFQKIHPIDYNYPPRRCNGKNIKTINADLDFIRPISETASRAPSLPEHLNSS